MSDCAANCEVPPCSRRDLRRLAYEFRKKFHLNGEYLNVPKLLELLPFLFSGIDYDIVDDETWDREFGKETHASYIMEKNKVIYIRNSIYERACIGKGRDRFTIVHEIAHAILLDETKIKFNRSSGKLPCYKDPEWQANCLAGELLIPYELCKDMSVDEIVKKCGVSYEAARCQKSHF